MSGKISKKKKKTFLPFPQFSYLWLFNSKKKNIRIIDTLHTMPEISDWDVSLFGV
jgi:hypothetical protein